MSTLFAPEDLSSNYLGLIQLICQGGGGGGGAGNGVWGEGKCCILS